MKNTLPAAQSQSDLPAISSNISIEEFNERINKMPKPQIIKEFDGAKYVPIRILEDLLNHFYGGIWEWIITEQKVMGNSIVTYGNLRVFHPVFKIWLTRSGSGAVPIQQKRDSAPDDFSAILKKALHKNAPSSSSFAFRNACKKLGKVFGSTLNNDSDEYIHLKETVYDASPTPKKLPPMKPENFEKVIKGKLEFLVKHKDSFAWTPEQLEQIENRLAEEMDKINPDEPAPEQ